MSKALNLAQVTEMIVDCEHKTAPEAKPGSAYGYSIGTPHIRDGRLLISQGKPIDRETYEAWTARAVPKENDLILAREAPVGQVGRVGPKDRVCLGQRTVLIRPDTSIISPRYLHYLMLSPQVQDSMHARGAGSTVAHLNMADIRALVLPVLPDKETQRRVGELLAALDDKLAINERLCLSLDSISRAMFESYFSGTNSVLPKGWRKGLLADLCTTQYGYTASAMDEPIGPKLLRVTDINKQNWIRWNSVPYCDVTDSDFQRYRLDRGDILVARMADPGKSAIIEQPISAIFASYLVRLKTKSIADAYFVYGFLKSDQYADYCMAARSGSVQSNMNAKVIVAAQVTIPPAELISSYFEKIEPLRLLISVIEQQSVSLAELRDALLPRLISGELRVKEAELVVSNAV